MERKTLYVLFFENQAAWKQEYERRFQNADTIHLDIQIGEHPAFVCQTISMYQKIVSIERWDKRIRALHKKLPGVAIKQFSRRCLIDEIIMTNNIEGVNSTRKDIQAILQTASGGKKKMRFVGLVHKYDRLMQRERIPMDTCQDIRNIYDAIFYDEIKAFDAENMLDGEIFRKESVSVYSKTDREMHRGLMPESKIISTMEQSLHFLHDDTVEPLIRTAIFHYLFGYIHPFYDGNGRTSRFISSYLLSGMLDPLIGYRISNSIKESVNQYQKAFKICNDFRNVGDLTPFAEMFIGMVETSVKQLYYALENRVQRLGHYASAIERLPYGNVHESMKTLYFLLIQAALFSDKGISRKELLESMKCSYGTLLTRLAQIPEALLLEQKEGRSGYYMLNLDAVDRYLA